MRIFLPALALLAVSSSAALAKPLAPGTAAPAFTLESSTGKPVKLADYRGKRVVLLAFFPKAFTGG